MVAQDHFQRLKRIYTSSTPSGRHVAISYGRAQLDGTIEDVAADAVLNRMPHQRHRWRPARWKKSTL
jgi:hypothetical protein